MSNLVRSADNELLEDQEVLKMLGYPSTTVMMEEVLPSRGYRILSKIPRLPVLIIGNLVAQFGNLSQVLAASIEELDEVDGIGEVRARTIKEGLKRIRDQVLVDRHI